MNDFMMHPSFLSGSVDAAHRGRPDDPSRAPPRPDAAPEVGAAQERHLRVGQELSVQGQEDRRHL